MEIFNVLYQKVSDEYSDEYFDTRGGLYYLGTFSSEAKAREAIEADLKSGVKGEKATLETRDDVPSADEGMVRVVDGIPHGYYTIMQRELDKPDFHELTLDDE